MSTVVMNNVVSLDGFIADLDDDPGPLFDWYFNGDRPLSAQDMDDPAPAVRSMRPLREAHISVEDVEGQPGWYRCAIHVKPHFKYMGASFTLSLVGKLDKN